MESWTTPSDYDTSLEWPGLGTEPDSASESFPSPGLQNRTCFRLVVKSSEVLARKRRVAVLDAYEEVQIGRDASISEDYPRIRLKEMEVSKLHATLYRDRGRKEWAVVDMGSKHGTFVKSGPSRMLDITLKNNEHSDINDTTSYPVVSDPTFARLSPPRVASMPRTLRHSDELAVGSTVFLVHIHPAALPCDECHSEGEFDIPLFSVPSVKSGRTLNQQKSLRITEDTARAPRDAKSAMTLLKKSLLSRHSDSSISSLRMPDGASSSQRYIDRSAKRRALHPYSRSISPPPGVVPRRSSRSASPSTANVLGRLAPAISLGTNFAYDPSQTTAVSAPSTPISDANVGHRLLEKQGWVPGSTLGVPVSRFPHANDKEKDERTALSEPLQVAANIGRRGLGMRSESSRDISRVTASTGQSAVNVMNWKVDSQFRRWDEAKRRFE